MPCRLSLVMVPFDSDLTTVVASAISGHVIYVDPRETFQHNGTDVHPYVRLFSVKW